MSVHHAGELGQGLDAVTAASLVQGCLRLGLPCRVELAADLSHHLVHVQVGVPDGEIALSREPGHRLAIAGGGGEHDLPSLLRAEPVVAAGYRQARRQPLHVPLERSRMGLVEVVDVEGQPPLRGGEDAEVAHVRVPAQLHVQPGVLRARQVGRHDQRAASVERERRRDHAPVPDRDELGHPRDRLALQQRDRVGPAVGRELGLRLEGSSSAREPSGCGPVRSRGVGDLRRCRRCLRGLCHGRLSCRLPGCGGDEGSVTLRRDARASFPGRFHLGENARG